MIIESMSAKIAFLSLCRQPYNAPKSGNQIFFAKFSPYIIQFLKDEHLEIKL